MRRSTAFAVGLLIAARVFSSDHIDGPVTTYHRVADLTDLYAFPTPGRPGFLTILLDAYPLVPSDGHFSDKVTYTILVRRASIQEAGGRAIVATGDERALDCTFATPERTAEHVVTCRGANGLEARSRYDAPDDRNPDAGFRIYAGMRADPFFLNTGFFSHAIDGQLDPPDDSNAMRGANVLTIALEIELRRLYETPPSMIAVAAEATTRDAPGGALRRLDRVGRPETTNLGMTPRDQPELRDLYNMERPFQVPAAMRQIYRSRLARNVALFDALDGRRDWQDRDREALVALIVDDFLVIDLDRPCPPDAFLEIETSILRQSAHRTCGGRRPEDDIMDTLYTLYIAGLSGDPVRDGVDRPATALAVAFPYLAPPDLGWGSRLRVFLARQFLGIPDRR